MVGLLSQALPAGASADLCRRLLAIMAGQPEARPEMRSLGVRPPARVDTVDAAFVEPLTNRELEVLTLLAQGLNNKAIARKLVLTEGTVKAHAHNIYAKLVASTRGEAVARARQLGILP